MSTTPKCFRLTQDDLDRLERLAKVSGLSQTDVIRRLLQTARLEMRPAPVAGSLLTPDGKSR